jgi:hypothetical protein
MSNTDPLDPQRLQKVDRFVDTELGYITTSRYTVINFPTNSSEITDEIQAQIAKLLNRGPSYIIVIKSIIGYASEIGSLANNIRLSGERAQAMASAIREYADNASPSLDTMVVISSAEEEASKPEGQKTVKGEGVRVVAGVDNVDINHPFARSVDIHFSMTYTYPPVDPTSVASTLFEVDFGSSEVAALIPFVSFLEEASITMIPDGTDARQQRTTQNYTGTVFTYPVLSGPMRKKKTGSSEPDPTKMAWSLADKVTRWFSLPSFTKLRRQTALFAGGRNQDANQAVLTWLLTEAFPHAEFDVPEWLGNGNFLQMISGTKPGFGTSAPFSLDMMKDLFLVGIELNLSLFAFTTHFTILFACMDRPYSLLFFNHGINLGIPEAVPAGLVGGLPEMKKTLRPSESVELEFAIKAVQLRKK